MKSKQCFLPLYNLFLQQVKPLSSATSADTVVPGPVLKVQANEVKHSPIPPSHTLVPCALQQKFFCPQLYAMSQIFQLHLCHPVIFAWKDTILCCISTSQRRKCGTAVERAYYRCFYSGKTTYSKVKHGVQWNNPEQNKPCIFARGSQFGTSVPQGPL